MICEWIIKSPDVTRKVKLDFEDFDLENPYVDRRNRSFCRFDYVYVSTLLLWHQKFVSFLYKRLEAESNTQPGLQLFQGLSIVVAMNFLRQFGALAVS